MKRIVYILFVFAVGLTYSQAIAQELGKWQSYLSYQNATLVAEGNEYVYAVGNGSLFGYGTDDNSIVLFSKESGLSDTQIVQIGFNNTVKKLLIVYSNGNMDLLDENGRVKNIPYLMSSTNAPDKTVNDIYFRDEFAYLSTNFGVILVDLVNLVVVDTYRLNKSVGAVCIEGDRIYASADSTIMSGALNDNLVDFNNWDTQTFNFKFNKNLIRKITFFEGKLCMMIARTGIYYHDQGNTLKQILKTSSIRGMKMLNDQFLAHTAANLYMISSLSKYATIEMGTINDIDSRKNANTYWIASGYQSLTGIRQKGAANEFEVFVSGLEINSPKRNYTYSLTLDDQKLLIAGGGMWSDRNNLAGTFMIYDEGEWTNYDETLIRQEAGIQFRDVTSVAVDPENDAHYYVATWGEGVFEFEGDKFVQLYSIDNSTLKGHNNSRNYVRVEGLVFDKYNNLWMNNSSITDGCINILKADGKWARLTGEKYSGINNSHPLVGKTVISSNNQKWIPIVRGEGGSAIFVLDDGGTIDDVSDDRTRKIPTFYAYIGGQLSAISVSTYYCITEDKNGYIWIGTNNGLIICSSPANALSRPDDVVVASRIVREAEDGELGYFLDGENIKAIAVDGGNRKWIGTESSGLYVVNEDGSETIAHFDVDNSPILSNSISSLAINQRTGEVFIGTDKGLISYMGGATEGKEDYSEVYAFPNPVRPEYEDMVTITGLMTDSNVKITDLNGNLIFQEKSHGGQLTWNCRNGKGERVATGIYLVLASQPDRGESVVTKIMVIK